MIALVAALVLSQAAPDAGALAPLYQKCVEATADAPLAEIVDGGYFTPELRAARNNCKLAACETKVDEMLKRPEPEAPPQLSTVLILVGGGLALAAVMFAAGYAVPHR